MALISRLFEKKERTFSFEVFPVSTPEAFARLLETLKGLCELGPDFISCTYGAGGGNRERTFDVVEHIQKVHRVPAMAHLTCVLNSRADIESILREFERRGIENVLALRGDPPKGSPEGAGLGDFQYSKDLVAFIRSTLGRRVSVGVAGFPEKHLLAPDADADARYLKSKIDAGADFVITQLFFDNAMYFRYVERLRKLGVKAPVLPGVLPVTDFAGLKRFCERCGATVTAELERTFGPLAGDPAGTLEAGVEFATRQCRALLAGGAPGIHFYTLNRLTPTDRILSELR